MMMWVDPPSGWRYGFPKIYKHDRSVKQWLIDNGYPENDVDWAAEYIRCWPVREDNENAKLDW